MKSFGVNPVRASPANQLDVSRVTRRNVKPLLASAPFDEVLDHIEHSHDNTYPVVNDNNELIGIIRYPDVRDILFDPFMKTLVTAEDLAVNAKKILRQEQTLGEAWSLLNEDGDDCVPVTATQAPNLYVGVVRRRDLLRLLNQDQ